MAHAAIENVIELRYRIMFLLFLIVAIHKSEGITLC